MRRSLWVPLAISVVAAYIVLDRRATRCAAGYADLEEAANKTSDWGSEQRITGTGRSLLGKVKEGFGRLTGDPDLAGDGVIDQFAGALKDASGKAAHVVGDTIHDLNR